MQYFLVLLLVLPSLLCAQERGELYNYVPGSKSEVDKKSLVSWLSWSFLGNDDDGLYGEKPTAGEWTCEKIGPKRAFMWWVRNPMHNFTFYVIGSAYKKNSEFVILKFSEEGGEFLKYHKEARTVFAGSGTSFFLGFHGWKPFISLRLDYGRRLDFYFGWRERGNFGIKFVPSANSYRIKRKKCYSTGCKCQRNKTYGTKKKI